MAGSCRIPPTRTTDAPQASRSSGVAQARPLGERARPRLSCGCPHGWRAYDLQHHAGRDLRDLRRDTKPDEAGGTSRDMPVRCEGSGRVHRCPLWQTWPPPAAAVRRSPVTPAKRHDSYPEILHQGASVVAVISLQRFDRELRGRLEKLTPDEIRAAVLRHAAALPGPDRIAFLEVFAPAPGVDGAAVAAAAPAPSDPALPDESVLDDIDAFVERLASGHYYEYWGWDDDQHDERAWGDESWAAEMDALFTAVHQVFLSGDLRLARAGYEKLLTAFGLEDGVGVFCGPVPPPEMIATDLAEASARYLRCIYQTAEADVRANDLAVAWLEDLPYGTQPAGLAAVREALPEDLPDFEAFLPEWLSWLRDNAASATALDPLLRRLLTEAALLHGSVDALGELARSGGAGQAEAFLEWIDALRGAGRAGDAAAACREALSCLPRQGPVQAAIAERLGGLAAAYEDDPAAVLDAWQQAWRAWPSSARLLAVHAAAQAAGDPDGTMGQVATEASAWTDSPINHDDCLRAELLLLAGRIDDAAALLDDASRMWRNPAQVVLPYLLAAGSGAVHRPDWSETGLARLVADAGGNNTGKVVADQPPPLGPPPLGPPPLGAVLRDLITRRTTQPQQRSRWLATARAAIDRHLQAIVGGQQRAYYNRAAQLAVACGEALSIADPDSSEDYIAAVRAKYLRHIAFRRELDAART